MESDNKFVTLEMACRSLKQQDVRLLDQISRQLASVLSPDAEFNPETIRFADGKGRHTWPAITYGQVASYFSAATGKYVPVLFETPELTIESCRVLVNRGWIDRQAESARERLGLALLISAPAANQQVSIARQVNGSSAHHDQPAPLTSDGLENLHSLLGHQNSQRKAQEAAGRESIARQKAEERALRAEMLLRARDAELKVLSEQFLELIEQKNSIQRRLDEASADAAYLEQQLEVSAGLLEFMDPRNPESPPVGRQLLTCWIELTQSGTRGIMSGSRRGTGDHIKKWLRAADGAEPGEMKFKAFRSFLTPASRKQGGAVPSSERKG